MASDTVRREESSSRMSVVFDRAPAATLIVDADGRIEATNRSAQELLCRSDEALTGRFLEEVLPPGDQVAVSADQSTNASVLIGALPDGASVVQLIETRTGESTGATLDEHRAFRLALLELGELSHADQDDAGFYAALLSRAVEVVPGAQAGSILVHREETDEYHFVAAEGFDLAALQRRCLYESEMFRDVKTPEASINSDLSKEPMSREQSEWLASAGRIRDIAVNVSAPVFVSGEPVAFISLDNFDDPTAFSATSVEMTTLLGRLIADLLRRRELEAELRRERESFRHLALHDGLTGLANRRHIENALAEVGVESANQGEAFAVLFVDVDDFKRVNDEFGHAVGDEVVIAIADGLRRATRPSDLVGRWGGDEFMILARRVDREADVVRLAERVLRTFDDDIVLNDGRTVTCRLSIGASWTADGSSKTLDLVRRADGALYEAKHAGKHTLRVSSSSD